MGGLDGDHRSWRGSCIAMSNDTKGVEERSANRKGYSTEEIYKSEREGTSDLITKPKSACRGSQKEGMLNGGMMCGCSGLAFLHIL